MVNIKLTKEVSQICIPLSKDLFLAFKSVQLISNNAYKLIVLKPLVLFCNIKLKAAATWLNINKDHILF